MQRIYFSLECSEKNYEKLIKVSSETEYFQRAYDAYAHATQNTTWSFSFKKEFESIDVGLHAKGGIAGKFSANLGIDVSRSLEQVKASTSYHHDTEAEIETFGSDLQLVRRVVTTISIGGDTTRNEVEEIHSTYPKDQRKNETWLREEAIRYMMDAYDPDPSEIPNKKLAVFEQSACAFGTIYCSILLQKQVTIHLNQKNHYFNSYLFSIIF